MRTVFITMPTFAYDSIQPAELPYGSVGELECVSLNPV